MKRIGLALGGGGARGIAHIAVIEALEEMGQKALVVSGTSAGAMVGAMYAGGLNSAQMLMLMKNLSPKPGRRRNAVLSRISKMPPALLAGWVKKFLKDTLPESDFSNLKIPLKIMAANFFTLEEKVFETGSVLDAVMSSIALPGVFAPYRIGEEYFIDGGCVNLVPFDIIRDACDVLVAVDVSNVRAVTVEGRPTEKDSVWVSWAATEEALMKCKLEKTPVEIFERLVFNDIGVMAFGRYQQVYEQGVKIKEDFKRELKKFI